MPPNPLPCSDVFVGRRSTSTTEGEEGGIEGQHTEKGLLRHPLHIFASNNIELEQGIVIKSTGSRYKVLCGGDRIIECIIKGKFRVKELRATNPVAVGDNVLLKPDKSNY